MTFARLIVLPFIITGIMLLLYTPIHLYVGRFGTPVVATVDSHEITTGRRGGRVYLLHYHYTNNGLRYDESRAVGASDYGKLQDGERVQGRTSALVYLTIRSRGANFVGPWSNEPLISLFFFSIVWNVFVGIIVYLAWWIPFRQRWPR